MVEYTSAPTSFTPLSNYYFNRAPLKSSLLIIGDTSENGVGDLSFWLALDCCIYRSNVGQYFKYSCAANAYGGEL